MKPFYSILLILILLLAAKGHCQKSQFDKQDDTSIYSFLKKNNLTNKTEHEFYTTYLDRAKAKELYSFFVENKLTNKDFFTFYKDLVNSKVDFSTSDLNYLKAFEQVIRDVYSQAEIKYVLTKNDIKSIQDHYKGNHRAFLKDFYKQAHIAHELSEDDFVRIEENYGLFPASNSDYGSSENGNSFKEPGLISNNDTPNNLKSTDFIGSSFQIDKIKVGASHIELPIPSGFVKVDDTMGILLEIAQKMCPETNTLLAYYISEEDYANYLVDQNHIIEKYIFVQVFNEFKNIAVSGKDYRKFVNSFKKQYVDEFKAIFDDAGLKIIDNFLKIDEDLKLENFKMQPFGICYESKNSISYGILSKYNFLIDGDNSVSQIVAAISTIAKIDNKPIFLFAYKTYRSNEDIKSLKAMNSNWIQEIDRKQSPASFIADIDFEDYKEGILAILTLSFIWAIYFATKKIHKKIKEKAVSEELEVVEKNNLFDFDELLKDAGTAPNDLTYKEEIAGETLQEKEEILAEPTTVRNPELLKVGRRMRLLHFLIDMLFLYFLAYCSGYILVFIFGPSNALKIVEHTYLFGGSLAFIVYFSQEFIFGKTLGKLFTGTRVVDSLGNKPGIVKLIIRTISRLIPLEAFSFLGSNKRGWHDTISDTFVIKD